MLRRRKFKKVTRKAFVNSARRRIARNNIHLKIIARRRRFGFDLMNEEETQETSSS
ncbi:hypothetical protein [Flocculibacter collagenilyticus]|uniref:hypothetical protein n=1 Tax=Flocculibacter collagenilyticus TaxID=2744479 RepID=UPI0018F27F6F|nr:hypothetical protein [Flocculibacter collagenilyticus]